MFVDKNWNNENNPILVASVMLQLKDRLQMQQKIFFERHIEERELYMTVNNGREESGLNKNNFKFAVTCSEGREGFP